MRIADTLLRRGHLSEDVLVDAWYSGERPGHLDRCDLCAERALEVSRWLEQTRDLGLAEADAAFPAERLAAQQSQILHRLEQLDRPSRLLSFPRTPVGAPAATAFHVERRVSSRWIAAAAAAGLVLGVIGGRLSVWQPTPAPQATRSAATELPRQAERLADPADDLLLYAEISQPQIQSLSALDTLTPQVTVAQASSRR